MGIVFAAALAGCGTLGGSTPHLVPASEVERASAAHKAAVVPAVPPPPIGVSKDPAAGAQVRAPGARDSTATRAPAPATAGPRGGAGGESTRSSASSRAPESPVAAAPAGRRRPETRQGLWIRVEGPQRRVSFEWSEKGLGDVVSLFAEQSGRDIILAQGVESVSVTASIRDQEWHLALESVLLAYDLRPVESS